MMPTNDERREVAARLRDYENLQESLRESPICAFLDALGVGYLDWKGVCNSLAELIEPEPERTCKIDVVMDNEKRYVKCSHCGYKDDYDFYLAPNGWNYCLNCGAKVVSCNGTFGD